MPTRTHQPRRRLVRPPSKQILQLREEEGGAGHYDSYNASPYPCPSPSSSSWAANLADEVSASNQTLDSLQDETDVGADSPPATRGAGAGRAGGPQGHCTSPHLPQTHSANAHQHPHTHNHHHLHRGSNGHSCDAQPHAERTTQRATTISARRGGKSSRKSINNNNSSSSTHGGQRSSSTRACPAVSHSGYGVQHQRHHSRGGASPVTRGGFVKYYGPSPATALVSPSLSSTSLADAASTPSTSSSPLQKHPSCSTHGSTIFPTTLDGDTTTTTTTHHWTQTAGDRADGGTAQTGQKKKRMSNNSNNNKYSAHGSSAQLDSSGDAGTAPPTPPGGATASPTTNNKNLNTANSNNNNNYLVGGNSSGIGGSSSSRYQAATTPPSTRRDAVDPPRKASAASAFSSCDTSRATATPSAHDTPSCLYATNNSNNKEGDGSVERNGAANGVKGLPASSSPPTCRSGDTPLTYAAVASASSTSSLHGKKLPQSRVGFGNFRKRVCGGSVSAGSTQGTPPMAGSPSLFSDSHTGNSYTTRGYCASSCGFPSVPLTPLTCNNNNSTGCGHGAGAGMQLACQDTASPASPSVCAMTDGDAGANDIINNEEEEDDDDDGGDGESDFVMSRNNSHHSTRVGGPWDTAEFSCSPPTAASASALMPPLPPSLHRNHPTNLFLQLPHQHEKTLDSDEEEITPAVTAAPAQTRSATASSPQKDKTNNGKPKSTESQPAAVAGVAAAPPTVTATTTTTAAQRQQALMIQDELNRCKTSSTMRHTGPAVAAKAAAGLHLMPIAAPSLSPSSSGTPSASSTPSAPTIQKAPASAPPPPPEQQPQPPLRLAKPSADAFYRYPASTESTPTGPAPATVSNVNSNTGKGMHKVSSSVNFFNAAEIIPGLYLGAYSDATDTEVLAAHGISLVINCSLECAVTPAMASNPHHVRYVQCPLRDHSDEAISPFFSPVTQIIHEQLHRRQINQQRMRKGKSTAGACCSCCSFACSVGGKSSSKNNSNNLNSSSAGMTTTAAAAAAGCACACHSPSNTGLSINANTTPTSRAAAPAAVGGCTEGNAMTHAEQGSSNEVDALEREQLQNRMVWTWADEAENVWAVPSSPASPPLSVGGQPSLKEGKRETPRTPSSNVAAVNGTSAGAWGRNSEGSTSLCTSGSPSPMPGRTATFPGVCLASAATPIGANDSLTNTAAKGTLNTSDNNNHHNYKNSSSTPAEVQGASVHAGREIDTPLTVVDPRDCGGVLVHCRMGVSRSATFVMAYLILYGFTLATLEDTASLFVRFLERERSLIEDAGGRARFAYDLNGSAVPPAVLTPTTCNPQPCGGNSCGAPAATTSAAQPPTCGSPLSQAGALFRNSSLAQSSRFSTAVSSPTGSGSGGTTPASTTLVGGRRPMTGFTSWYAQRSNNNNNNNNLSINSTTTTNNNNTNTIAVPPPTHASPALGSHRRSAALPVASPLFLNNGSIVASPRSTASSSQLRLFTQLTPLEVCARVCRPCHLQRLRERRLQQQVRRNLLISGQQQQQQQEEEEEQMIALAALSRMRGEQQQQQQQQRQQQQQQQFASNTEMLPLSSVESEEAGRCAACGDDLTSDTTLHNSVSCGGGCGSYESTSPQRRVDGVDEEQQQQQQQQFLTLRPLSSSAPVVSYRGSRGSFNMGRTLLETALADDEAKIEEGLIDNVLANEDDPDEDESNTTAQRTADLYTVAAAPKEKETQAMPFSRSGNRNSGGAAGEAPLPIRNAFSVSNASAASAAVTTTPTSDHEATTRRFAGNAHSAQPRFTSTSPGNSNANTTATNSPASHYNDFPSYTNNGGAATATLLCRGGVSPVSSTTNNNNNNNTNTLLYASCDNSSIASSHSVFSADLAPAMTFREAFDAVKKQKADVNPNIGFVLALRELAGNGDFSFSTSL